MVCCRDARIEDIPVLIEMGEKFYEMGEFRNKGITFNKNSLPEYLHSLIPSPLSFVIVAYEGEDFKGSIAGIINPLLSDVTKTSLTELWFWSETASAGERLIKAFELRAKLHNIQYVIMSTHDFEKEKVLERYYRNMGFEYLQKMYIKDIR